jgi:hypothetical protein
MPPPGAGYMLGFAGAITPANPKVLASQAAR